MAGPLKATGLTNDTAPFYAGDWLDGPREECTGGFNVLNASGKPFMLTAGHCGSGTYYNDSGVVETTSTNWFTGATSPQAPYPLQWDVQALATSGGEGYVWTDYGNVAPIVGALLPAVGVTLTANGSITGEQAGEVDEVDFIADKIEYSPGQYFDAVHQIWIENDTPTPICTQGDSGGPVYQWDGSSHVYASGIISSEGIFTDGGVPVAYACAATLMTSILSGKNATLVTAP